MVDLFVRLLDREIVGHLGQLNDHRPLAADARA
jgi:hypothetical protein